MAQATRPQVLAGVGVAAAAAAALAGAYYLYGTKQGAARRKKIKGWALKMKGEVLERLEDLKEVNQEVYDKTVETVGAQYERMKNVTPAEVAKLVAELKGYWKSMNKELTRPKKAAKRARARVSRAKRKAVANLAPRARRTATRTRSKKSR